MNKLCVILDCPYQTCDKLWIVENWLNRPDIIVIDSNYTLAKLQRSKGLNHLKALGLTCLQCIQAAMRTKEGDILICWSNLSGTIMGLIGLFFINKKLILSMNWLTPSVNGRLKKYVRKIILSKKTFIPIVNCRESVARYSEIYGKQIGSKFKVIPDVYDDTIPFCQVAERKTQKYCFTGGMNNRDWKTVIQVAKECKEIDFVCVALKSKWNQQVPALPNLHIFFDLPSKEYYRLMKDAYVILLPLEQSCVSGLINIIKAAQFGQLCLVTGTEATEMYFPQSLSHFLLPFHDVEYTKQMIQKIFCETFQQYQKDCILFQNHIQLNFSPAVARKLLNEIIDEFESGYKK